jgi:hypothetical protein
MFRGQKPMVYLIGVVGYVVVAFTICYLNHKRHIRFALRGETGMEPVTTIENGFVVVQYPEPLAPEIEGYLLQALSDLIPEGEIDFDLKTKSLCGFRVPVCMWDRFQMLINHSLRESLEGECRGIQGKAI